MSVEKFLKESRAAEKTRVEARLVLRRFTGRAGEIRDDVASGTVPVSGAPICELVAGGVVLGRGEIHEENGVPVFTMTEVAE
jgi:hypothetical protein